MPVSCFTSPVLPVSGFSQGECYRDLQAADPSRKLIQYLLRTTSTNLRSHLTGSYKELYRKVLEQKGWTEIIQRYLETWSSTTSAATTVPVTGIQGRKPRLVVWLRTGVSSGNRPTNIIESTENTAGIARRLGCLECLGRLSWMLWESSGISEITRVTNVRFSYLWTDDLIDLIDRIDTIRCVLHYDTI